MKLFELAFWLSDIVPEFVDIDGRVFISRGGESVEQLRLKIAEYNSPEEAQSWINIVPIDAFIDEVDDENWSIDDPVIEQILKVYATAWSWQIQAKFPSVGLAVKIIRNDDDVGLKLLQVPS